MARGLLLLYITMLVMMVAMTDCLALVQMCRQAKGHTTTGHTPLHAKRPHPQMPSWATNGKRN